MWPMDRGLQRLSEQGFRHVALADFQTMAGVEQFDRLARGYGLEPWLGVTLMASGPGGLVFPVRLFGLSQRGYRLCCQAVSDEAGRRLDQLADKDLGLSLPPESILAGKSHDAWLKNFGWVAEEVLPNARGQSHRGWISVPYWPVRYLQASDFKAYQMLCRIGEHAVEPDARAAPEALSWRQMFASVDPFPFEHAPTVLPNEGYQIPRSASTLEEEFASLRRQAEQGLKARYSDAHHGRERLLHELGIIRQLGFQGYFLLVSELTDWARSTGIRIGPGRGSAAGSLVSYALGITEVDPLKYGLIFERFLNPERGGLPDIDLDVDYSRRTEILDHLRDRWGNQRVAQIGAYGTLGARAVLRDVARAKKIAPEVVQRVMASLDIDGSTSLVGQHQKLAARLSTADPDGDWLEMAEALEGLPRHASIHAAGVVIAPDKVTDFVPVTMTDGHFITQMEMASVERLGLVKLDVLGLRTLSVLDQAERWIRQSGHTTRIESVPEADAKTLRLLAQADTDGVFQLDGSGVKRLLEEMRPRHLTEVMAVVALYRPGPMEAIPQYLAGRRSPSPHAKDSVDEILRETYGVMVYQEQLMAMVRALAGYSWAEADQFRRAVSKRDHQLMAMEEERLLARLDAGAMEANTAKKWVSRIHAFADYGFNKSHAAAYGLLAYYLAYLKAHWPLAFWAAELSSLGGWNERMHREMRQIVGSGIAIRLPEINLSGVGFRPDDGEPGLIAGLDLVRGVGVDQARRVVEERERNGPYRDYDDYRQRMGLRVEPRTEQALKEARVFRRLVGSDGGSEQLSLFAQESKPGDKPQVVDCLASFGWPWPVPEGPIYFATFDEAAERAQLSEDLAHWARQHPGRWPLVQVMDKNRGKRWPFTVSGHFTDLDTLREIEGIRRVSRQVRELDRVTEVGETVVALDGLKEERPR